MEVPPRHMLAVRKTQEQIQSKIIQKREAELLGWKDAISAAKRYFRSAHFRDWYPAPKKAAVKKIRTALRYPEFGFSKSDWDAFYDEWDLGHIRQAWKGAACGNTQGFRRVSAS